MGKTSYKHKNREYGYDDYDDIDYDKRKPRKKQKPKPKYFDEFSNYETDRKYNNQSQKFRY